MRTRVEPYSRLWVEAVKAFNARLTAGGAPPGFLLDEHAPSGMTGANGRAVWQEQLLAVSDGAVHGGFILQRQPLWIGGVECAAANYQTPISEGIIDRAFAHIGPTMLRHALRESPVLFAVGMGSLDRPFPKMLTAMRWHLQTVPFLFYVFRPGRVVREFAGARASTFGALAGRVAASTGIAALAVAILRGQPRNSAADALTTEPCEEWQDWVDALWSSTKSAYALASTRTRDVLDVLYPAGDIRYLRIRFRARGDTVGWVVLLDTVMRDDRYFGNLRVGVLLDGVARPEYVRAIVVAATRLLGDRGVDLVVTNQTHDDWIRAARQTGYLRGPSNYLLAISPSCAKLLAPLTDNLKRIHVTRGDGDGRIHLMAARSM